MPKPPTARTRREPKHVKTWVPAGWQIQLGGFSNAEPGLALFHVNPGSF